MGEKEGYPNGQKNGLPYPGPPEYVEHGFPAQPSYPPPPMGIQTHAMQPYGMQQGMPYGQPNQPGMPYGQPNQPGMPYGQPKAPYGAQHPGNPYTIPTGGYPVVQQPFNNFSDGMYLENAPPPGPVPNSDPTLALEYLKSVTSLQIRQKIEILELINNVETVNKYVIYNEQGQPVLNAIETSECCNRQCCGPARELNLRILDLFHNEVIHLYRPLRCQSVCYPCCLQEMEITSPPGTITGRIEQKWSLWPKFDVFDSFGNVILRIEGPFCTCSCKCGDVTFQVLSTNGVEIGTIKKKWAGYEMEAYTNTDTFAVDFPADLDIHAKVSLLGAVFLLDMMYFEQPKTNNNRRY